MIPFLTDSRPQEPRVEFLLDHLFPEKLITPNDFSSNCSFGLHDQWMKFGMEVR
jgi:hypothetical protein